MAITQSMATSFKQQILVKGHDFTATTGDTFKMTLHSATATISAGTADYTAAGGECASSGTYAAGGSTLTSVTPTTSGTTAFCDFSDISWTSATISADGAGIWNSSAANAWVAGLDFGSTKTSTSGTFSVTFPTADASNAILRIA